MNNSPSRLFLDGSFNELQNKNILICLTEIKNFDFYSYLVLIISKLVEQKNTLTFLEVNSDSLSHNFLHNWEDTNKFKRHKDLRYLYRKIFYDVLTQFEISFKVYKVNIDTTSLPNNKYTTISDLVGHEIDDFCKTSILSIYGTHQTKSIEPNTKLTKFESKQINHMINTFNQIEMKLSKDFIDDFESIIVLNGRMPDQSAIRKVAALHGKEIYFFEHGGQLRESFHFENFMPQNVVQMQETFLKRFSQNSEFLLTYARPYIDKWIHDRLNSVNSLNLDEDNQICTSLQRPGGKIALICSSSLSEYELYSGAPLNLSQAILIKQAIKKLLEEGFEVILRIHPNECNNNWINLLTLMRNVSSFNIRIFYPWESVSTYKLVEISDVVVVWDSTIGLESYLLKKPIYVLNDSFYSKILGISRISTQELSLSSPVFVPYKTDADKGALAAFLRLFNGISISDSRFNQEMLKELKRIYFSHLEFMNSLKIKYRDLAIHRIVRFVRELMNFRFPIRLERKLGKFFGKKISIFIMKVILRWLLIGGKDA